MYNFIIFDVDGTLINTENAVASTYNRIVFEEFGRNCTSEELKWGFALPSNECIARIGFKNVGEAVDKYNNYLTESFCKAKVFKGIPTVLDFLENKAIAAGIVTARSKREVDIDQNLQELLKHFEFVVCADDTEKHKPEPEPILKLLNMANAEASNTVYIGDTFYDYMCARNSRVDFGLALWGAKTKEGIEADYHFKEPEEIMGIL